MTDDALLLIGREATDGAVYETHAERLRHRGVADTVHVGTYGPDPHRDLRETLAGIDATRVYAVPLGLAHTNETTDRLPGVLSTVAGDLQYCEPVGRSPVLTHAIDDRARTVHAPDGETTLVLVAFGNTSGSYHRQVTDYHATRLRDLSDYAAVRSCYLLQNPTVECVRYNVATDHAVVVPLFVAPSPATTEDIPAKLELDRGGLTYADPLGTHERVTDAIHDRVETQRVLAHSSVGPQSFEATLTGAARPIATDGEGKRR